MHKRECTIQRVDVENAETDAETDAETGVRTVLHSSRGSALESDHRPVRHGHTCTSTRTSVGGNSVGGNSVGGNSVGRPANWLSKIQQDDAGGGSGSGREQSSSSRQRGF